MLRKLLISPATLALLAAWPCHASPTYVDATTANTTLADGSPYTPTASVNNTDNQWSLRTGFGNGGSVYTSNDSNANPGEDAPTLRTTITGLEANREYEISVYFWVAGSGAPVGNQEWDIRAGLSPDSLTDIRHNTPGTLRLDTSGVIFTNPVLITEADRRLFLFILGTTTADANGTIPVFIDDFPGNDDRTWYDGVGHATLAPREPATWTGEGPGDDWSLASNWLANAPPEEGDELVFGPANRLDPANNLPADRSYASLRFPADAGSYEFRGNRIALAGPLVSQAAANQIFQMDLLLQQDLELNLISGTIFLDGILSGPGGLNKSGQGSVDLSAANFYQGRSTALTGTMRVHGDQSGSPGGWWVGPGTAAATTVSFLEESVIHVAAGREIRVGNNAGSLASSLAAQNLLAFGTVTNHGSLETGLQAFLSLETGAIWNQHGPVAIRGYNNWNSRLTIKPGAHFLHHGTSPIQMLAGTGNTGRGRIVIAGGLLTTPSGFLNENPDGPLRPVVELSDNGTLRASAPLTDLNPAIEILLGADTGILDTSDHAVTASGPLTGPGTLAKDGSGSLRLTAESLHTGNTVVRQGRLTLNHPALADNASVEIQPGASLELNHPATDTIAALILNGNPLPAGIWGGPSSGAPNTHPSLAGTGSLLIPSLDPYPGWIASFPALASPADQAKNADPDGDGLANFAEFALDADPSSPAASAKLRGRQVTLDGGLTTFVLTLPVRLAASPDPADPAGGEFVLTGDGLRYRIQASADLQGWLLDVSELAAPDAAALHAELPPVSPGWSYRSFRGPASEPAGFLRVTLEEIP